MGGRGSVLSGTHEVVCVMKLSPALLLRQCVAVLTFLPLACPLFTAALPTTLFSHPSTGATTGTYPHMQLVLAALGLLLTRTQVKRTKREHTCNFSTSV